MLVLLPELVLLSNIIAADMPFDVEAHDCSVFPHVSVIDVFVPPFVENFLT